MHQAGILALPLLVGTAVAGLYGESNLNHTCQLRTCYNIVKGALL